LEAHSYYQGSKLRIGTPIDLKTAPQKEVLKARKLKAMGVTHRKGNMILSAVGTTESELP